VDQLRFSVMPPHSSVAEETLQIGLNHIGNPRWCPPLLASLHVCTSFDWAHASFFLLFTISTQTIQPHSGLGTADAGSVERHFRRRTGSFVPTLHTLDCGGVPASVHGVASAIRRILWTVSSNTFLLTRSRALTGALLMISFNTRSCGMGSISSPHFNVTFAGFATCSTGILYLKTQRMTCIFAASGMLF
jgi:hypothetical protein